MNEFNTLVGLTLDFYGVCNNCLRISVPGETPKTFEAIADDEDGLRSMLSDVMLAVDQTGIFYATPITQVVIRKVDGDSFDGFEIHDASSDHRWLRMGTDKSDDFYPMFMFEYSCVVTDIMEG